MRAKNGLGKPVAEAIPKKTPQAFQKIEAALEETPLVIPNITVKRV